MTQPDEEEAQLVFGGVDRNPMVDVATEADEDAVLRELYGEPDPDGIFRGAGDEGQALAEGAAS